MNLPTVSKVLVIYGVPPEMDITDVTGKISMGGFTLTKDNKASFESALRHALASYMQDDTAVFGARFIFVKSASGIAAAIKTADYTQVVYYGHALVGGANGLVPDGNVDHSVYVPQLVKAFQGTKVVHFDILGCMSAMLAAELFILMPKLKIGYLRDERNDDIEINYRTRQVISLRIEPQKLFHYGK